MSQEKRASITDIAKKAGVSATTVSRVLNDTKGEIQISEKTRQLVLDTATHLGYRRNPFASALRTSRTGIVGAVSPNLGGTYFSILGQHLQGVAQQMGIELLIGAMQTEADGIAGQLSILQSQIFDGVLFLGDPAYRKVLLSHETHFSKPYVHVMAETGLALPLVGVNNALGITLALDHLVALGHTRIAFIGSPARHSDRKQHEAYKDCLRLHDLPYHQELVSDLDQLPYTPEAPSFREKIRQTVILHATRLLSQTVIKPTAILCASDGYAAETLKAAYRLGMRVPEDVSIIGYGDQHEALITFPELTTVRIPNQVIAEAALKLLAELIEDPESEDLLKTQILADPELVIRQSTVSPP
jgi:LacI family transcriptional regulator